MRNFFVRTFILKAPQNLISSPCAVLRVSSVVKIQTWECSEKMVECSLKYSNFCTQATFCTWLLKGSFPPLWRRCCGNLTVFFINSWAFPSVPVSSDRLVLTFRNKLCVHAVLKFEKNHWVLLVFHSVLIGEIQSSLLLYIKDVVGAFL